MDVDLADLLDGARRRGVLAEASRELASERTNLAQSIARVLEHAFKAGVAAGRADPGFDPSSRTPAPRRSREGIDLPPRVKALMERIARFATDRKTGEVSWFLIHEMQRYPLPTVHVLQAKAHGTDLDDGWGSTTTAAAVRLGLLAETPGKPGTWTGTDAGVEFMRTGRIPEGASTAARWGWGTGN